MSDTLDRQADDLGFDPEALKQKYRAERDRRLRQDGSEQYVEIATSEAGVLEVERPFPVTITF